MEGSFLKSLGIPKAPRLSGDLGDGKLGLDRQSTQLKCILMANREAGPPFWATFTLPSLLIDH